MPVTNWITKQNPKREPMFHQYERFEGDGRVIKDLIKSIHKKVYSFLPNSAIVFIIFLVIAPFIVLLVVRSVLIFSCDSVFITWVLIEVNMLRFIRIIVRTGFKSNKGETLQYLFIQRASSLLFISASFLREIGLNYFFFLTIISLMIKLGAAPFHFWFINIVSSLSWDSFFILSTIQKLIPLLVLNKIRSEWAIFPLITAMIRVFGVFFRNNLKLLLAYSSLFRLAWLLRAISRVTLFVTFLRAYSFNLIIFISVLIKSERGQTHSLCLVPGKDNSRITLILRLLRIGGLPPIIGFLAKVLIVNSLLSRLLIFAIVLLRLSRFLLYLYLRVCLNSWKLSSRIRASSPNFYHSPLWILLFRPLVVLI